MEDINGKAREKNCWFLEKYRSLLCLKEMNYRDLWLKNLLKAPYFNSLTLGKYCELFNDVITNIKKDWVIKIKY
jgi:hypothetical protein